MTAFHLSLPVHDLDAAVAFYTDVLGCERRRTGPGWVDVDFFGHQLSLHEHDGYRPPAEQTEVDAVAVPLRHHGVVLDPPAWRALVDRLRAVGTVFLLEPITRFAGEPGEQSTFFVTDPSGNALEVKAFPGGVWV